MNLLIVVPLVSQIIICSLASPIVKTDYATFIGTVEEFEGHQVEQYLGIPFARPPIGKLRFRKPVKLAKSRFVNPVYNATEWPNYCPQLNPYQSLIQFQSQTMSETACT